MDSRSLEKLAFRAKVARGALIAYFLALAAQIVLVAMVTAGAPESVAVSLGLTGILPWIALLVFAIAYFLWLHRAAANLGAGAEGMRYSPAWHVASYFVPLANIVVPFFAMRELWNRSHGEPPELADAAVGPIAVWWTCWVAAVLIFGAWFVRIFLTAFTNVTVLVPPLLDAATLALAGLLMLGASWFVYRVIGAVTRAQTGYLNVGETFA